MTTKPIPPAVGVPLTEGQITVLQGRLPEKARLYAADLAAYWRALPHLLADGEEGRWALVAAGKVTSVWDTLRDARQAGYERYGAGPTFLTPRIDRGELGRLAELATAATSSGDVPCPS